MKCCFITFMVEDLAKTIEFYEKAAGLKAVQRMSFPGTEIAMMAEEAGDTMIEFIHVDGAPVYTGNGPVVAFNSKTPLEDVHKIVTDLGYEPGEIDRKGPEPANFKVKDCNGITVEFCQIQK